jgi:hypothetical protein
VRILNSVQFEANNQGFAERTAPRRAAAACAVALFFAGLALFMGLNWPLGELMPVTPSELATVIATRFPLGSEVSVVGEMMTRAGYTCRTTTASSDGSTLFQAREMLPTDKLLVCTYARATGLFVVTNWHAEFLSSDAGAVTREESTVAGYGP